MLACSYQVTVGLYVFGAFGDEYWLFIDNGENVDPVTDLSREIQQMAWHVSQYLFFCHIDDMSEGVRCVLEG